MARIKERIMFISWILLALNVINVDLSALCSYSSDLRVMTIYNFRSNADFYKTRGRCVEDRAEVLVYRSCSVGIVELDTMYVSKSYTNVKQVLWSCNGRCLYYPFDGLTVQGTCVPGNFFCFFYMYYYLYQIRPQMTMCMRSLNSFKADRKSTDLSRM